MGKCGTNVNKKMNHLKKNLKVNESSVKKKIKWIVCTKKRENQWLI